MKIALTGGIACGKSLLARYLSSMGAQLIDADDVVHELQAPGGAAVEPIVKRFGKEVLGSDGGIDRRVLSRAVFGAGKEEARRDLEQILFPMVRERISAVCGSSTSAACAARQPYPLPFTSNHLPHASSVCPFTIAIIPLLFESHWDGDYDIIITLVSGHEAQVRRMAETRGQSRDEAEARIAAQMPLDEKAARADYVVRNDSTPQALYAEAVRLMDWLKSKTRG